MAPYRQPILAQRRVRYVGEPVAAVFAEDAYMAEDGADAVLVDTDDLEPVLDVNGPVGTFDDGLDTEPYRFTARAGDTEPAFASAHRVITARWSVGRHSAVPLECRGIVAAYHRHSGVLELLGAAKVPFQNREILSKMVGLPVSRIVLREGHVGGGFGVRGELYPEDVLAALGAMRLGRPVKWIEDRQEHLMAANHSRDQRHTVSVAVDADGVITGLDVDFVVDQGAYVRTHGATVMTLTATMLPGPYRIPNMRISGRMRLSNKTPAGTYRAPGRYEGTFVRERTMDLIAAEMGIDRAELRRRNLIHADEMPYERGFDALGTPVVHDSGEYEKMLDRVLDHIDYPALTRQLAIRRASGERVGLGFGFFVEKSGLGPYAGCRIEVDTSGCVTAVTGASSLGQGLETAIAQICGDVLEMPAELITVVHGQTDQLAYGKGSFASRATVMAGSAAHGASLKLRDLILRTAAGLLEASPHDLRLSGGRVQVAGSPEVSLTLGEIAAALVPGSPHAGDRPGLTAEHWFTASHMNYPYGLHAAVVAVDQHTGRVTVERYTAAYDVGRAVNPLLIDGQLAGGAAQGLGGALLEEFRYDGFGQPLSTTFMDYLMPTAAEVPPIETLISEDAPSPLNPLGLKGAGEGGTTACGAAVASAIDDALAQPGAVASLPVTPQDMRRLCRQLCRR